MYGTSLKLLRAQNGVLQNMMHLYRWAPWCVFGVLVFWLVFFVV